MAKSEGLRKGEMNSIRKWGRRKTRDSKSMSSGWGMGRGEKDKREFRV